HGAPSINFNQFLEKEKLKGNGSNFTDWSRHVRIFLTGVSMQYVLEAPLGPPPPPAVSEDIKNVYETRVTYSEIQCAILCSLEAELQKRFEHHDPCEMMRELKLIFETHAAVESYEASKQFFNCMMEEGSSVSEHMFAMSGHAKKLSDLGIVIPNKLGIHRVLQSLPPSYKNFVMNYNMQNMNKELPELFSMLKSAEVEIKKENQVLMVNKTSFKKQGKPNKGNFKKGGKKVAAPPEKPKAGPKPETVCYYCQGKGHWKRNCTKYLADLKSGHMRKSGENLDENSRRVHKQMTQNKTPSHMSSKKRCRPSEEIRNAVILKSSIYPNKRRVAYATILDSNSKTLVGGVELGRQFTHVQIDEPIGEDERLVREREKCVTIGDAFSSGVTIAWPSACIEKFSG
ncbi:hypothetical protein QYE76_052706, partial [Lolium multiflorum]